MLDLDLGESAGGWIPLLDGCPECVGPESTWPGAVRIVDDGDGINCAYQCCSCGHVWASAFSANSFTAEQLSGSAVGHLLSQINFRR